MLTFDKKNNFKINDKSISNELQEYLRVVFLEKRACVIKERLRKNIEEENSDWVTDNIY